MQLSTLMGLVTTPLHYPTATSAIAPVERIVSLLFSMVSKRALHIAGGTGLYSLAASFGGAILLILARMYRVTPAIKASALNSLSRCIEIEIYNESSNEYEKANFGVF